MIVVDQEKTGRFIQMIRKEKGMTQQELAEKIGVSNKAVSKWETGRGYNSYYCIRK
ncbi:MAG: helix-turn-helix domain-containing protein [Blautia sp.]|nr:helix-turn-helix domain-containing protein [Blautia sp.]MCM1283013.1 helix-turn-helix domain-containing protein [Roseburia sp.]MCM1499885.1 helix-turn-helix domain-containing protein [Clostridium sp.]